MEGHPKINYTDTGHDWNMISIGLGLMFCFMRNSTEILGPHLFDVW